MTILYDSRWIGSYGIGRSAAELQKLLPHLVSFAAHRAPSHPFDPMLLAAALWRRKPDLFFSPGYNAPLVSPCPFVFTVHDLNHLRVPENSSSAKRAYYEYIIRPACHRAAFVLTVSEYSKHQIMEWARIGEDNIINVGSGVGPPFSPGGKRYEPGYPYLLYVGNHKPHKNLARLFQAFAASGIAKDIRLVLTGTNNPEMRRQIASLHLHHSVTFLDQPADEELSRIYRGALALVFPSLYEGFGLPALEALACGVPVVTSAVCSLPEVVGDAGIFVNPLSVESIADAIKRLAYDAELRKQLGTRGPVRAEKFSWAETARKTRRALELAVAKIRPDFLTSLMNPPNIKMPSTSGLRVALVHYWYIKRRGGERVLEVLAEMFPQADIFMLLCDSAALIEPLKRHTITTSFLQKLPLAKKYHRALLPLYPLALEQLRLDNYDLVISQESGPAKGVITRASACHICYCHTPMRYVWDMYHDYQDQAPFGRLGRVMYSLASHYVRQWDFASAARVDHFAASSENGARRIRKFYGRDSHVIYPPVDVGSFSVAESPDDFYLVVSPLVAYKRVDLAIAACNQLRRRLVVIGEGPESAALKKLAGPTVSVLGAQPADVVREHYRRCRAFLFPGEEDIGLTPIEAQASGRPVIAFGRGGALETVIGAPRRATVSALATGIFFEEQTVRALTDAMVRFEACEDRFSPQFIRAHADQFDKRHFVTKMNKFIAAKLELHRGPLEMPQTSISFGAARPRF